MKMAEEFKPINTQEEFDSAIQARLAREAKKYEGYMSPDALKKLQEENDAKIAGIQAEHKKALAEKDAKIRGYETDSAKRKIAHELGLSYDAADFLKGETEDEIRKSGELLKGLVGSHTEAPLRNTEDNGSGDSKDAALAGMLQKMKGE